MPYGTIKVDTVTFTDAGVDKSVSISGLVQNPTFSGNITVTGTISGGTVRGSTVSGSTVTGAVGNFVSGVFTTQISGATVTGGTANFNSGVFTGQISGATITGNVGNFTTLTGGVATLTSGVFASGTASAPSITFLNDLNTGIFSPLPDQISLATNGSAVLTVSGSRAAVGTSSPGGVFNVVAAPSTTLTALRVETTSSLASSDILRVQINSLTNGMRMFQDASSNVIYSFEGGQIGVTNTTPSDLFHIGNSSRTTRTALRIQTGGAYSDPGSVSYTGSLSAIGARVAIDGTANGYVGQIGVGNGANLWLGSWNNGASDGIIEFVTGNNTTSVVRAVINSNGLGIGITPSNRLDCLATNALIGTIESTNAAGGYITIGKQSSSSLFGSFNAGSGGGTSIDANALYFRSSYGIGFNSSGGGGVVTATFDTGNRLLLGITSANTSGGVLQLSSGITFPATQVASTNANTLDDYEEGTWTPTLNSGGTAPTSYDTQSGRYVKIGKYVWFSMDIDPAGVVANTASLTFGGLPFTPTSGSPPGGFGGCSLSYGDMIATKNLNIAYHITYNTTLIYIYDGVNQVLGNNANVSLNSRIILVGHYLAAD